MKRLLTIVGLLLLLTGLVWFFQGIGVIPGSFMTGQRFWAAAGVVAGAGGLWLLRRARSEPPGADR